MAQELRTVTIVPKNKKTVEDLISVGIVTDSIKHALSDLQKDEFYDVVFIHESFTKKFDRARFPDTELVVLVDNPGKIPLLLPALESLSIYTVLPLSFEKSAYDELVKALSEKIFAKKKSLKKENGKILAVTSFSSGVGKSIIGYNLAKKVAAFFNDESVVLIDQNEPMSVARSFLNLETQYSWHNLEAVLKEGLPEQSKVSGLLYYTPDRFALLDGSTKFNETERLSAKMVHNLQKTLQSMFRLSIFDMFTIGNTQELEYLENADEILVVIPMTSAGILQASRALAFVKEHKAELFNRMSFVANFVEERFGTETEIVAKKLGIAFLGNIDSDFELIHKTIDQGSLIQDSNSLLNKQFADLAQKLIMMAM